ncbi:MAG: tyrosine--tRNA ligase [Candidatus Ryanbacteria bacterium RIFCSPHIGHO2_02_FULL_48_12]|uniref:Tyrosine--tRNA ligase n=1 Tax=Candidatus Ryanbacteria bacterium RIFCSPHIGHO2_01_FULL_48_27 TaxID=1802115 RepID=A0A1G2G5S2_9BACT|nr:MAG: tyrosine--tRNA ligase [Candidatus Ryanbacteria bacterium RIFCSPHIGHO2_01_FULL_48_27]OGZ50409.1 MAG: tyrosine--tRNA ligase [Candidatus Ryanbacteria bacterium RIFCSPHIGHO2_02_FULL_48_12]
MQGASRKETIKELLSRGVAEVLDRVHLEKRLISGEKLRIKLGIDPTSPNIHLGRSVPLLKLRDLQELGHQIVFIVGNFTGVIGDTSDKSAERPMLERSAVEENLKTYLDQYKKILDIERTEIRYNAEWLEPLGYKEIAHQANAFSLAEFVARKNIKDRLEAGKRISLRELLYPLMQGYDSVVVKADLELGGTDQWFNLLAGRTLQEQYGQNPQDIMTMNLIMGTDGRKMSSSWGNTINLFDEPKEMFGKVMSMRDEEMVSYFVHCTRVPMQEVVEIEQALAAGSVNPRDTKIRLAHEITKMYWGAEGARAGEEYFRSIFQKKELPADIETVRVSSYGIVNVLVETGLVKSKTDARRVLKEGGVKVNDAVVTDEGFSVPPGAVLQKGKKSFKRIS